MSSTLNSKYPLNNSYEAPLYNPIEEELRLWLLWHCPLMALSPQLEGTSTFFRVQGTRRSRHGCGHHTRGPHGYDRHGCGHQTHGHDLRK